MNLDPATGNVHLNPLARSAAAILWPSFVAAVLATAVFFVHVDPDDLRLVTFPEWKISRELGYTLGFFMFWGVGTLASFFCVILLTLHVPPEPRHTEETNEAEQP